MAFVQDDVFEVPSCWQRGQAMIKRLLNLLVPHMVQLRSIDPLRVACRLTVSSWDFKKVSSKS